MFGLNGSAEVCFVPIGDAEAASAVLGVRPADRDTIDGLAGDDSKKIPRISFFWSSWNGVKTAPMGSAIAHKATAP
jgi:hypothetical protein